MKKILQRNDVHVNGQGDGINKPPYSNTGAENTVGLIDWNSFTLPLENLSGVDEVKQMLQISLDDFVDMPKGGNGYKSQTRCGDIAIFYDGKPEMGIHVCMTGQGCRQYEGRFGNIWKEFFKSVFDYGGHFARLDVALDDYRGRFTVKQVADKIRRREVRTYFRGKPQIIESHDLQSEEGINDGESVYFGSGQSDLRIRLYNKAVEQDVRYPWVRTEIQCRNERADVMAKLIIKGGDEELGKVAAGVLRHYVNFLEPSTTDTNKARWAVSSWWTEFLGCVERVKLTIQKAVKTIIDSCEWVESQVSTALALIDVFARRFKDCDGYTYLFKQLIEDGKSRLKPHHYARIAAAGFPM